MAALGSEQGIPETNASAVEDADRVRPRLYFQRVPEPKMAKNVSTWTSMSGKHLGRIAAAW
jgi:hypothetical protein